MPKPIYLVRYAPRGARNAYLVAMATAAAGSLTGIAAEQWMLLAPSFALAVVAERVRPFLGEHPQIRLDPDGLTLYGFGFLPWRDVADARAFEHTTGAGVRAWLMLEIDGDIDERVSPALPGWRRFQIKPWRRVGGRGLILRLEGLEDTPDAIRRAFERFLKKRIAVDRV
jgi:hypothetical protein